MSILPLSKVLNKSSGTLAITCLRVHAHQMSNLKNLNLSIRHARILQDCKILNLHFYIYPFFLATWLLSRFILSKIHERIMKVLNPLITRDEIIPSNFFLEPIFLAHCFLPFSDHGRELIFATIVS